MKFLLGTKIGMAQIFADDGAVIPVTLISAAPVTVTQVKRDERDGYAAVQVGAGSAPRLRKPQEGHVRGLGKFRWLREFRIASPEAYERGQTIGVSAFTKGDRVTVRGLSKGKGFAGTVKRHGFHGGWASHGAKHSLRQPGSIGASWPERVRKGKRMAGRMGYRFATVQNLEIAHVDAQRDILAVKGAVPGSRGTLLEIRSTAD